MCGIVGFSGPQRPDLLTAMCDRITHRGPDDSGYHHGDGMQLAMRRLAIVDIESGQQPVFNEDKTIVTVFNGEIYNHEALRSELLELGHTFRTHHSDTEVIVHAYEEWGPKWVERANGMFGLAILDTRDNSLRLYRDRMGKKPLYYTLVNGSIIFASEIKSILLHPDVPDELDPVALGHYFTLKNTSAPRTAYKHIRQLMPGEMLTWKGGKAELSRWWQPRFSPVLDITIDEAAAEIRRLLEDAVRLRMKCDAPFGAYLSGGVDSSAVATLMSRFHDRPVKTFCLGYADDASGQFAGKAQDIHHAREMAARIGSDHHELIIDAATFAKGMEGVAAAFDEPFSGTISTYFLSTLIKQHVKVAVSGDGADELFASYLTHRLSFPMDHLMRLRRKGYTSHEGIPDTEMGGLAPFDSPEQFAFLSRIADRDQAVWRDRLSVFTHEERGELLNPEFFGTEGALSNPYTPLTESHTAKDVLNRTLEVEQQELLPNQILPFVDRLSMAHSIEVRCPFLDHRLVAFASCLPGDFKIRNGINKFILKQAVADLLPEEVVNRPKEGFVQPIYTWMHGALQGWTRDLLESLPQGLFRQSYLDRLMADFMAGNTGVNAKVWNLACFGLWWKGR